MSEVIKTKKNFPTGKAGPGRPKGMLNKTSQSVKEAIELCAEGLGGGKRMIEWAKEDPKNETVFWGSIYPKLLPLQVTGENGNALKIEVVRWEIV